MRLIIPGIIANGTMRHYQFSIKKDTILHNNILDKVMRLKYNKQCSRKAVIEYAGVVQW